MFGQQFTACFNLGPCGRCCRLLFLLLATASLFACSSYSPEYRQVSELPPLQLEDRLVSVGEVPARVMSPDLLAVDDEMREFVARYTGDLSRGRQRLLMLHRAIKGPATLGLDYDPAADGSARQAFHRGSANCLSYASLFVALAREAGLDAGYQWLDVRPQWTREGERVAVRLHVNATVRLGNSAQYMVDIDPLQSRDITGSRPLTDSDAVALHHSNIAMGTLAAGELEQAWLHAVRALQLSPGLAHLWVNLGAIYRHVGQYAAAERSYRYALEIDPWEMSAMNNLAVLYGIEGRLEEKDYWYRRVAGYRDTNPYYHAWLGDQAAELDEWGQARQSYERAVELSPDDGRLLYALGVIHDQLGEPAAASDYIQRALETATSRSNAGAWQSHLRALEQRQLAGL